MEDEYKYPLYKVFTRAHRRPLDCLKENIKAWLYTYMFLHKLRGSNSGPLDALHTELLNQFKNNGLTAQKALDRLQSYDREMDSTIRALIRDNIMSAEPDMEQQDMMEALLKQMDVLQRERELEINEIIDLGEPDLEKLINELFSGKPGTNSEWVNMITSDRSDAAAAAGQAAAGQAAFEMEMEGLDAELERDTERDQAARSIQAAYRARGREKAAMQMYHEAARELDEGGDQEGHLVPLIRQAEELERVVASAGNAVTLAEEEAAASAVAASAVAASAVAASDQIEETGGGSRRKNTRRKNKNRKKSKRTKSKRTKSKRTKLKR